jgi:hypothetical protein
MTHNHDHSHTHSHSNDNSHEHSHTHDHAHSHSHSHNDGHGHDHDHTHSHDQVHELTLEQKLEKLLGHWINHNESHKDTFFTWAQRAKGEGIDQIALDLEKAGQLSQEVTQQLKDAFQKLKKA